MSYILEALKKAQAERQLGETPTIHAAALDTPLARGTPLRKPLLAIVAVMGVVIAGLAAMVWRQATAPVQPAPAARPAPVVAAAPVAAAPEPASVVPAPPTAPPTAAPAAAPAATPAAAPTVAPAAAPAASMPAPVAAAVQAPPAPAAAKAPAPRVAVPPAPMAPVAAAVPVPSRTDEPREEPVQALRDLPEPIRRAIPPLAMSGYMYSPNPSDRLILVDKVLRREGDEVAPGLVLERLEPKGAVFAFRGYRYRMPY